MPWKWIFQIKKEYCISHLFKYYVLVAQVFTDALPGCDAVVKDAFKQMYQLASQGKQGKICW